MTRENSSFGAELRRLRTEKGWTLNDFANAVHYSKSHLSKVENGHKFPSLAFARRCDHILQAEGRLASLAPEVRQQSCAAPHAGTNRSHRDESLRATPGMPPMIGEGALTIGAAALVGLGPDGRTRGAPLRSGDVLSTFRQLFDELRVLGQRIGPSVILPTVAAQTQALTQLAERASPDLARSALLLASRHAEYGGWMAQEAGDDRSALWWTDQAVQMAESAGDHELHAYALVRRGCVAMYAHDGMQTVQLAQQAQADHAASLRVRALAAEREAQGHALLGDDVACFRALDRSASLYAQTPAPDSDRPVLGSSTMSDRIAAITGWCLYDLGRADEAAAQLDEAFAGIPDSAVRARSRFGIRRSLAHANAGNLDHACALTDELLDGVDAIDSATIAHDVRLLMRTLTRWPRDPQVRALTPRLARVLHRSAA